MGRHACCAKQKLRKGLWSPEEDEKLFNYVTRFGVGCWSSVPKLAGLQRCGKSCRLRWINYLRPDLKRGMFSQQEEHIIISLHQILGNRWAQIAAQLPGRTDNEVKNFWNSCLKKKLIRQGIDPTTHKPIISQVKDEKKSNVDNKDPSLKLPDRFTSEPALIFIEGTACYNNGFPESSRQQISNKGIIHDDPLSSYNFEFPSGFDPILGHNSGIASVYQPTIRPYDLDNQFATSLNFTFTSMPSLASVDQGNMSGNSISRMSSGNCSIISSYTGYQANSLVENNAALAPMHIDNRDLYSVIQLPGIKSEGVKGVNSWHDNEEQIESQNLMNSFPIRSLSEDPTAATNFGIFNQM